MKEFCRPGGMEITAAAIELCAFDKGAQILDCGCGHGATVEYLNSIGLNACGVDVIEYDGMICANAEKLPFAHETFDAVLFECSLSKIDDPKSALGEAFRVLRPSGYLIVSDFYSRGVPCQFEGELLGRVESEDDFIGRVVHAGFTLIKKRDYSAASDALCAELIFKHGLKGLCELLGASLETFKAVNSGYFLLIFKKN